MRPTFLIPFLSLPFAVPHAAPAQGGDKPGHVMTPPPARWNIPPAPALTPEEALKTFRLADDRFRVELAAAEPLVEDPVCLAFDEDGRAWVCEMRGYMRDLDATDEEEPSGRIVILEDTDDDGTADRSTVFLDGIVLPRAIAHVEGGILYADHTSLYFVEHHDGAAGKRRLVDPDYAEGSNVEHKPNGLMHGLDNWIYSAKSDARYRKIGDKWVKGETEFRGQWGISRDDFGRIYTNTNPNLVNGEFLPPGTTIRNPSHKFESRATVLSANEVHPVRVTSGINRGYMEGFLDEKGFLTRPVSACGIAVYRGDNFPREFYGNVFVPEPAGNLVTRVLIHETPGNPVLTATKAWPDREFFASTDERSRIVNACTAPDGTLYLVDFYRGIIQHREFMTTYLKNEIIGRELAEPVGLGRIYRVVYRDNPRGARPRMSSESGAGLVARLNHPNGWWRDTAQRLIVQRRDMSVVPVLEKLAEQSGAIGQVHALWCLEGLDALTPGVLLKALGTTGHPLHLVQIVRLAESLGDPREALRILKRAHGKNESEAVRLQLALSLGTLDGEAEAGALELLASLMEDRQADELFADAALSGLHEREFKFLAILEDRTPPKPPTASSTASLLKTKLVAAIIRSKNKEHIDAAFALVGEDKRKQFDKLLHPERKPPNRIKTKAEKKLYALGELQYRKICIACHQENGEGQNMLAPPLAGSDWIDDAPDRLIAIVLDGMMGPIHVNGIKYESPEIQPLMPGLRHNPEFDDEAIAAVLTYIRNTWGNSALPISAKTVERVRAATKSRNASPYTETELKGF